MQLPLTRPRNLVPLLATPVERRKIRKEKKRKQRKREGKKGCGVENGSWVPIPIIQL